MTAKKILIIEDDLFNREAVTDLLEANGFITFAARTAEAGLRLARKLPPDLVLIDTRTFMAAVKNFMAPAPLRRARHPAAIRKYDL
jgi:CheY-like chemotaxis protein